MSGAAGRLKRRPALVLAVLPGQHQTLLVCGLSTDVANTEPEWDEVIAPGDPSFATSGLLAASSARLSFLFSVDEGAIDGLIGNLGSGRVLVLVQRLIRHLGAFAG